MLSKEDYLMIRERRADGVYICDIAQQLGVDRRTVRRALQRGSEPPARRTGVRPSKLDPFKSLVDQLVEDGVRNAAVIFRRLQEAGYQGKARMLRVYMKPKRRPDVTAVVRYETLPADQLQHDWTEKWLWLGGERRKVHIAVNVLGYARALHAVASLTNDAEHTYEAIQQAFEYFGGVTRTVLVDNQKAAVIGWPEGRPTFNTRFREMGKHLGFIPKACRPRRAQTKGKVERHIQYLKNNAFADRTHFDTLEELNTYLIHWCDTVGNARKHSELKEWVRDRLRHESGFLKPLPRDRFDTDYRETRQVSLDAYVSVHGTRYSVPGHLARECVELKISLGGWIRVFHHGMLQCEHRITERAGPTVTIAEHHAAVWRDIRVSDRPLEDYAHHCFPEETL